MSTEQARQFLEVVRTDSKLHALLQRFTDSRYADPIIAAGKQRGFHFTRAELVEAITAEASPIPNADSPQAQFAPQSEASAAVPYYLHPANVAYVEGRRSTPILRHKQVWVRPLMIGIILSWAVVLALASAYYFKTYVPYVELRDYGVLTEGVVLGRKQHCIRSDCHTDVTYQYTFNGVTYTDTQRLSYNTRLDTGVPVKLLVSPSQPDITAVEGRNSLKYNQLAGVAVAVFFALIPLTIGLLRRRREPKPTSNGTVVKGHLIGAEAGSTRVYGQGMDSAQLTVHFVSPLTNRPLERRVTCEIRNLAQHLPPANASVAIYFVDDQRWWVL